MNITIVLGDKIPSIKYGGTQRVMWYLGKELDKRGHKVTFIAGKGSYCPFAKVIELDPKSPQIRTSCISTFPFPMELPSHTY